MLLSVSRPLIFLLCVSGSTRKSSAWVGAPWLEAAITLRWYLVPLPGMHSNESHFPPACTDRVWTRAFALSRFVLWGWADAGLFLVRTHWRVSDPRRTRKNRKKRQFWANPVVFEVLDLAALVGGVERAMHVLEERGRCEVIVVRLVRSPCSQDEVKMCWDGRVSTWNTG